MTWCVRVETGVPFASYYSICFKWSTVLVKFCLLSCRQGKRASEEHLVATKKAKPDAPTSPPAATSKSKPTTPPSTDVDPGKATGTTAASTSTTEEATAAAASAAPDSAAAPAAPSAAASAASAAASSSKPAAAPVTGRGAGGGLWLSKKQQRATAHHKEGKPSAGSKPNRVIDTPLCSSCDSKRQPGAFCQRRMCGPCCKKMGPPCDQHHPQCG